MTESQSRITGLRQNALIVVRGFIPCGCELIAASSGGDGAQVTLANLTSPGLTQHLNRTDRTRAELFLFDGHRPTRVRGDLQTANVDSVRMTSDPHDAETVEYLRQLPQRIPGQFAPPPASLPSMKDAYQKHTRRLLGTLVADFIDQACEGIGNDLEHAAEVREITRLKDMRFIFNSRGEQLYRDFTLQFQAFDRQLNPSTVDDSQSGELRVVEQHVFEDWLELQMVASELASKHSNTLFVLSQLLNQLFSCDISDRSNPLSPLSLCTCLQFSIDRLGIAREHRGTLYLAFETVLDDLWPRAAESLNRDLRAAGLLALDLTSLPSNWSLRESDKVREAPADTPYAEASVDDSTPPAAPASAPGRSLLRLMSLQHDASNLRDTWPRTNPQFTAELRPHRDDLRKVLGEPGPSMEEAIRHLASSNPDLEQALDDGTWDKVTLVDRLFAPLEREQGLNRTLREQLEQLRLPVLEVLLETSEFLDSDNHPARTIVNDLMRLCLAERSSSRNLEQTVTGIIDELIQTEERDEAFYRSIGTRLRGLVERQEQSFQRNSERIAKTLEGKERLRQTRLGVQRRLNMILAGKAAPTVLLDLLNAGWEQLIVLAVLREGAESQTATSFINIVEQIRLWLSDGETSKDLAFERELESDALIQLIDRELRTVGEVSPVREVVARLTRELHQHTSSETVTLDAYPPGSCQQKEAEVSTESVDTRWARRAQDIGVGDWVEIALDNGERRRMRLVWGGKDVFRFVFLSPQGLGEVSYQYSEFVSRLARGDAWLVKQGDIPFVDQSLFDIVQEVYSKLNFEATHDALTGCLHRHDFEKQLAQALSAMDDNPCSHTLMVFDIDEFSVINATYGTGVGDELLKRFASLLQEQASQHSGDHCIGRLGGNEFALLAKKMPVEEGLDFSERLRDAFRTESHTVGDTEFSTTLSASVCPFEDTLRSAGELMNQANLALKSAKRKGGNGVERVREQSQQVPASGPLWVPEIDRSIRDGSLYLRAQRILPLTGGSKGDMYELLLGLQNSSGQEISPQSYIEAAEQFRRSSRVDLWVIDEAIGWMEEHPDAMENIHTFNINLSGASLSDDAFLFALETRMKQHNALTHQICFEVTETSAVANLHYAADFMTEMKRLGCRFALDDFGTGLSSYAYLQKLPVDYVKVDGIFVRDMASNLTNYALVRSITELCHFLDIKTIAEYVEDMETLELLKEIQVDFGQGFCIAKPRRMDSLGATAKA